ncbi:hypothetical protein Lser_V15G38823 [Lactuca serriola]
MESATGGLRLLKLEMSVILRFFLSSISKKNHGFYALDLTSAHPFSLQSFSLYKQPRSSSNIRKMGEGKGSSLVHLLVIILCLVAFGFAIAAERRHNITIISAGLLNEFVISIPFFCFVRSRFLNTKAAMNLHTDNATNSTYCVYDSDVATGYGVGAFLFLLSGESLLMGVTKCMCFGRPLAPGGNRAWTIIYFTFSF